MSARVHARGKAASIGRIVALMESATTPTGSFDYFCDQLCMPEGDEMRTQYRALVEQEAAKVPTQDGGRLLSHKEAAALHARVRAALPEKLRADLSRYVDFLLIRALAESTVSLRVGLAIGKSRRAS